MKQRIAVVLVLGMLPWAGLHAQQTASTTFKVSATVEDYCDVAARDPAPGRSIAQLRTTCSPNATYNVALNKGWSRSVISGNTTGTETVTGVGTGQAVDQTVFGAVPASRIVPASDYANTITVHVYY